MATFAEKLVDKTVNIVTNEGRNFVGTLKSFDQRTNLILADCHERIYSATAPVQHEEMGLYFIRGDNIAIIGEIDEAIEATLDYAQIKAPPLKSMQLH